MPSLLDGPNSLADTEDGASHPRRSSEDHSESSVSAGMRKSHSAVVNHRSSPVDGSEDGMAIDASESRRPYTTTAASSPTKLRAAAASAKKKAPAKRIAAGTSADQRPRSAGLNGWGDFDADRLLQGDDFFVVDSLLDETDGALSAAGNPPPPAVESEPERARSRRMRHSAPATTIHDNPAEDFPPMPQTTSDSARLKAKREQPRPATHVLRQRPLAVVDFDSARQLTSTTPTLSSRPRGRIHPLPTTEGGPPLTSPTLQPNRLPHLTHMPLSSTESLVSTPLFGSSVPDSHETRALVFEQFRTLWRLMASRPSSASAPVSPPRDPDTAQAKSPFECSMMLRKICKSVGLSLGSSASPPTLTFWSSSDHDVDFQAFCTYAIRHAIQPALHHFNADSSVDEFVASVDRILANLVTTACLSPEDRDTGAGGSGELRLKDLAEIRSLFPHWKVGMAPLGKLQVGTSGSRLETPSRTALDSQQEDARGRALPSRREPSLQLPTHEAKAMHDANIRRKVQLHKSWQARSVLLTTTVVDTAALEVVRDSSVVAGAPSALRHSPLRTNADRGVLRPTTSHAMAPTASERRDVEASSSIQRSAAGAASEHEPLLAPVDEPPQAVAHEDVLVCGACATADAALWCASCFSVFCVACWQRLHLLRVDATALHSPSSPLSAPLAPPTKQLKPQPLDDCSGAASPPFAMIYLPTKPLAVGKLARGGASRRPPRERDAAQFAAAPAALPAVSSHALLPPLLPSHPPPLATEASSEAFESTSNLVRALMLGAAAPLSGSSPSNSSTLAAAAAPRTYADPKQRARLRPAPVLLDAAQVLQL